MDDVKQWTVTVDYVAGQGWEASVVMADGEQFGWASSDPHTLMAAIGRDLQTESGK